MRKILVLFLLLTGCSDIQQQRVHYCEKVVAPELCHVLMAKGQYRTAADCLEAMEAEGICLPPISSGIADMNECVFEMHKVDGWPESCAKLRH